MWDVFISHASENKDAFVRQLAEKLQQIYKVSVWYDEFSLEYGDSLLESIEKGLQNSKYGLVVFSKEFFNKAWTNHEYKSLKTKEMMLDRKIIIPIWYKISKEEIANYSLTLADKFAINVEDNCDFDDIASKIIKIIRPDIYNNISRMKSYEKSIENSKSIDINFSDLTKIPTPPVRHKSLSIQMKARLKLIYNAIKQVDKRSYYEYEQDFRRSINLDREIIITELLTAAYIESIKIRKMTQHEKELIYGFAMMSGTIKMKSTIAPTISYEEQEQIKNIINSYINGIDTSILMEYMFPDKN